MSRAPASDLSALIAETERIMSNMQSRAHDAAHTSASLSTPSKPSSSGTTRSITHSTYEEHKTQVLASSSAAALRALSPNRHLSPKPLRKLGSPLSPSKSSSRLFSKPLSTPLSSGVATASSLPPGAARPSPLSPREQARRVIAASGVRSPARYESGVVGAGLAASTMRSASASPSRFRAAAEASRAAAAELDATMRYENLFETPAPIRTSRVSSPAASPTRFSTSRPAPITTATPLSTAPYTYLSAEPWRELNRQLSLLGFPMIAPFPVPNVTTSIDYPWSPTSTRLFRGLTPQAPSAALSALLSNYNSLLSDYARRGNTIQDLMAKNAETNSSHAHCHAELASLRRLNSTQQGRIEDLQRILENTNIDKAHTLTSLSNQIDQSSYNFQQLDIKYQQSLLTIKQKDEALYEWKRRAEDMQKAWEKQAQVGNERNSALLREQEVVHLQTVHTSQLRQRELEAHVQQLELSLLSAQNSKRELEDEMTKREANHAYTQSMRALEMEEKLNSIRVAHDTDMSGLRQRSAEVELDLHTKVRALEDQVAFLNKQNLEMTSLNTILRNDLTTVATSKSLVEDQVTALTNETILQKNLIAELELQKLNLQNQAIHGYNVQELTKYLNSFQSSSQLIRRDKLGDSFEVAAVAALPKELLVELVLLVCMKLKIADATAIGSALDKLIAVASAVPGMQDFIAQIWSVVSGSGSGAAHALTPENLISLTTSVIPTLKQWQFASNNSRALHALRLDVLDVLRRRVHRSPLNPLHSAHDSSVKINEDLSNEDIIFELNDIVSNENRLNALVYDAKSPSSFFQLWSQMDKTPLLTASPPGLDSEKIIAHIQQLFDVPHKIGLFPRMNELFLFVSETRPAIQALRSLLKLDSKATIHTCIKALKRLVENNGGVSFADLNASSASNSIAYASPIKNGRGLAWTVSSPSKTETSFLTSSIRGESVGTSAPSHAQMQRNANYWNICKQLKAILKVNKMADIVGAVQSLAAQAIRAQQPDFLTSSILAQLTAMLDLKDLTEIPTRVIQLRNEIDELNRRIQVGDSSANAAAASHAVSQELAQQLAHKREEFISNLKDVVGVSGGDDTDLVSAVNNLVSLSAAGQQSHRDNQLIISQLKGYLSLSGSSEIVQKVRTIKHLLDSYDQIYPQLDAIVTDLFELLHVSQLDDIVPAVRQLVSHKSGNGFPSSSTTSSVRGVTGSMENSPSLSAISDVSEPSKYSLHEASAKRPVVGSRSPYRQSPNRVTFEGESSSSSAVGSLSARQRREEQDAEALLSAYAPSSAATLRGGSGSSQQHAPSSARKQQQEAVEAAQMRQQELEDEIDRNIERTLRESAQRRVQRGEADY